MTTTTNTTTAAFRTELELALGWLDAPITLRELAALTGSTVSRVRYHATALANAGRLTLTRDTQGRVLVALPVALRTESQQERHGLVRRCLDGAIVCPATRRHVERSARSALRELHPRSGAPEPGLGVIYVHGLRCWVEPPIAA